MTADEKVYRLQKIDAELLGIEKRREELIRERERLLSQEKRDPETASPLSPAVKNLPFPLPLPLPGRRVSEALGEREDREERLLAGVPERVVEGCLREAEGEVFGMPESGVPAAG